jgi:hypothetical protein
MSLARFRAPPASVTDVIWIVRTPQKNGSYRCKKRQEALNDMPSSSNIFPITRRPANLVSKIACVSYQQLVFGCAADKTTPNQNQYRKINVIGNLEESIKNVSQPATVV